MKVSSILKMPVKRRQWSNGGSKETVDSSAIVAIYGIEY